MQKKSRKAPAPIHAKVRKVRVDAEQAGQRIDNFLRRELPGVPKGRLYRILRRGEVRVNGGRIRAEYKLQEGDEVRVPPARVRAPSDPPGESAANRILDRIIFEDKKLLVIDKPSGVAGSWRQRHQPRRYRAAEACATRTRGPVARASPGQGDVRLPGHGKEA